MKKKILFMVSSMNIGGVEKSLLSLLNTIPEEKYDITVLMLNKMGGFLPFIPKYIKVEEAQWFKKVKPIMMNSPYNIIKTYLKAGRILNIPSFIYGYYITQMTKNRYYYYKNILKAIPESEVEYDIAVAYAGPTEIIDTYISHKVKAKKKIAWVHFDVSKHEINKKLYEKLYSFYDKVFVVSKEAKAKLDEVIPSVSHKSEVMLNIVSKDVINNMAAEQCELYLVSNYIKIVTVGRLSKEKGQDLAVEALLKLKEAGIKVKWYCVGEGNYRKELEEMITKYNLQRDFILVGAKANPYPYMRAADIYVQTSRHEGYCLTLAEAKVLNKPIITTDFVGAKEQIKHNENGIIVSDNGASIYEEIVKVITENELKVRLISTLLENTYGEWKRLDKFIDFIES